MTTTQQSKTFCFRDTDAQLYGINAAVLLYNIRFWLDKNVANNKNLHDGRYWTYNSISAFEKLFPFLTYRQIHGSLDKLVKAGILVKGNYNKLNYDRTIWYSVDEEHYKISSDVDENPPPNLEDRSSQIGGSNLQDWRTNTIYNTDIKADSSRASKKDLQRDSGRDNHKDIDCGSKEKYKPSIDNSGFPSKQEIRQLAVTLSDIIKGNLGIHTKDFDIKLLTDVADGYVKNPKKVKEMLIERIEANKKIELDTTEKDKYSVSVGEYGETS